MSSTNVMSLNWLSQNGYGYEDDYIATGRWYDRDLQNNCMQVDGKNDDGNYQLCYEFAKS
jgi:hypothetical protein